MGKTARENAPGGLAFKVNPYIEELAKKSLAVRRQFYPSPKENRSSPNASPDPLNEDQFEKTHGLFHKYRGRVLITLTDKCAAHCRFCTRSRRSGLEGGLVTRSDIRNMTEYLLAHPEINEAIFSGGDPPTAPELLKHALEQIGTLPQIDIVRVHTRVPISNPRLMTPNVLEDLKKIKQKKRLYVSLHFEHPDELTSQTIEVIEQLHGIGAILLSQSVFLKGVNDSYNVLYTLFTRLSELGVRPYYIYHCDPVRGAEHFIVPLEKEVKIMTKLRTNLSGIAFPTHVIDAPNGSGKIPVPQDFWEFKRGHFRDFDGKRIKVR